MPKPVFFCVWSSSSSFEGQSEGWAITETIMSPTTLTSPRPKGECADALVGSVCTVARSGFGPRALKRGEEGRGGSLSLARFK